MVTKSQDHSLAVYPREAFEQLARRAAATSRSNPRPARSCATWLPEPTSSTPTRRAGSPCPSITGATRTCPRTA